MKGASRGLEGFNAEGGFEGASRGLQGGFKGASKGLERGFKDLKPSTLKGFRGLQGGEGFRGA